MQSLSGRKKGRFNAVLISHDHYDHLDMDALKEIESKTDHYFVPLGIEKDLQRWDIPDKKIKNFAWWEETKLGDLRIACTPARHYSVRNGLDNGETLWCSWVLKDKKAAFTKAAIQDMAITSNRSVRGTEILISFCSTVHSIMLSGHRSTCSRKKRQGLPKNWAAVR